MHIYVERADGAMFDFGPSHKFLQVHFHYADGKPTKRGWSVATIGAPCGRRRGAAHRNGGVVAATAGAATDLLGNLAEGGRIRASGPYGRFCLMDNDANHRYLLVATGTGVTPYRLDVAADQEDRGARSLRWRWFMAARK